MTALDELKTAAVNYAASESEIIVAVRGLLFEALTLLGGSVPPVVDPPPANSLEAVCDMHSKTLVSRFFRVEQNSVTTRQPVWFNFAVANDSSEPVPFGALAAHTDVTGVTALSWTKDEIKGDQTLTWRDHIMFDAPGTYRLYLGICYAASVEECKTASWDRLSSDILITVM